MTFRLLFGLLVSASAAWAQPKLTSLSPDWIQRGATLDVTFTGQQLNSVTGFVFSGESGLSASLVMETPKPGITIESSAKAFSVASGGGDRSKMLRARLTAAADAAMGVREVRVVGANGISEPLTITVGAVPEVAEVEPNNSIEKAQVISIPSAVAGVIQGTTEIDYFRFSAKKGEQLVLEVVAQRSGSPLDSSLALFDAKGRELARSEDARGFDSVIEFNVPDDGDYFAQLRDFQYRGGGDYKYRLFVSALPFVDYLFPFGGQRGKPVEISVVGRNVQGAEKMTLNIDAGAPLGRQEIRLNTPRGLSSPMQFDVQDFASLAEAEPNNEETNANAVVPPVAVNGRIGAPKDVDRFTFKAVADQKMVCAVEARRFGSPLDTLLAVYAGTTLLSQNDDADGVDARIEFDAKKDTTYSVAVRDLTGRGGDNFGYRLAIRPASAASATFAAKYYPDAVRLNRGGRTRVRCEVVRQGFDGPVRVTANGLPDGVSAEPLIIPAGRSDGDLLLTATPESEMGTLPLRILASAQLGGKEVTQLAAAIAPQAAAEKTFKEGFLSILEATPFTVDALTLAPIMDQLKSGTIDVLVNRRAGFTNEVKVSAVGFSAGRELITKSLDVKELAVKSDARTAQLKLTAKVDAEVGTRVVLVRCEATHEGQTVVQFSQPVALTVTQIPFVLTAQPPKLALNIAPTGSTNFDEVTLKVKVDRRGFNGEIPLVVDGLPAGVEVRGTNVAPNAAEASVVLTATEKSEPLTNGTLTVKGAAMFNDRLYRHQSGGVKLVISPPASIEVASTNSIVDPK